MQLPDIRTLVPHSGPMVLLDRVDVVGPDALTALVTIRVDSQFSDGRGVGSWIGIEYMAQAIAALAGHEAIHAGGAVKPGFLLGTRRYTCNVPAFPTGSTLAVSVRRELQGDNGLASFTCAIEGDGILAEATISVFQPDNVDVFLQGHTE